MPSSSCSTTSPIEDPKKVRVSGPFTVESLSPHRSLAFAGSAVDSSGALNTDSADATPATTSSFEQTILANLRAAGIQNGRRNERLTFDSVEPTQAPTSRRSGSGTAQPTAHRGGSASRSARSTGRSGRRSSRTLPVRRIGPVTWICCACWPSRSIRRCWALATTT